MNDELRAKLISIIEAVERGAPGIAERIIADFVAYHTVLAVALSVFAVVLVAVCALCFRHYAKDTYANEVSVGACVLSGGVAIVTAIYAIVEIAVVQAPVYHLLRELR